MKKLALILAATLVAASPAAARPRVHNRPACHSGTVRRTVRVTERRHGRRVTVRVYRCVAVKVVAKPVAKPIAPAALTLAPTPPAQVVAPPAPGVSAPTPEQTHAGIDPSYTQDPSDPLRVTWTYSASGVAGTLPPGTLAISVSQPNATGPSGGCVINVGGATTGGTCTVELSQYGPWSVSVTYTGASATVAPSTSTDTETIEPPATTVNYGWGTDQGTASPQVSATVIGSTARTTITDGNFEGASAVTLSDDLGDACQATVSGTTASCQMPVTGTPSRYTIQYPGGVSSQGTRAVPPNGTQPVTFAWPASIVAVPSPSVTVQQATVYQCGGYAQGEPAWSSPGVSVGCGSTPGPGLASGQWPNPVTVMTGNRVELDASAYGNVAGDRYALGHLTFTVSGPAAPSFEYDQDFGAGGSTASQDCSNVTNTGGQAVGGCVYTFSTPGVYTVSVRYVTADPNYANVPGPVETLWVS